MIEIRNILGFLCFFLGMMYASQGRYIDAAVAFGLAALLIRVRKD